MRRAFGPIHNQPLTIGPFGGLFLLGDQMETFTIQLTETHLKKATLNGSALAAFLAPALGGFSFDDISKGEGAEFLAAWGDGSLTRLKFYRPRSKAEKRFSLRELSKRAKAGDWLCFYIAADPFGPRIVCDVIGQGDLTDALQRMK
jgi:hypothetical protein